MGIRTVPVERRDLFRTIRTVGLVGYEESRQYSINSKIEGWVERLHINQTGQSVKKGQPLLEIYSPELVAAQQEYLLALENDRRMSRSPYPEIAAGAARLLEAAGTRLKWWDITDRQVAELGETGTVRKAMTLYSPNTGVVTMKKVVEGMRVMAGEELLQISDLSRVWVNAEIYEYEVPWVKPGQTVSVEVAFAAGKVLEGKITYIYPYLQNETRTVKARIELPNPNLELKPDMYVNVRIETQEVEGALSIPDHAVLKSGKGQTVFVALGEGRFEPRAVQTGVSNDEGFVQVLAGLDEGEQVVTSAQFMLDSESKLREAIQKMTAPSAAPVADQAAPEAGDMEDLFQ
jgi:Cu(I)/Ag(I) efflux system membrane fusion protein/cobalt-zinc-cadmium efflux system membrane fusion protein